MPLNQYVMGLLLWTIPLQQLPHTCDSSLPRFSFTALRGCFGIKSILTTMRILRRSSY